jgi:hypothetical protein
MPLKAGDSLRDQYHIERMLGEGGIGYVYLAHDTVLHRQVAIKELLPGLVGSEPMLRHILVEARATMDLTHERIVRSQTAFPGAATAGRRAAMSSRSSGRWFAGRPARAPRPKPGRGGPAHRCPDLRGAPVRAGRRRGPL